MIPFALAAPLGHKARRAVTKAWYLGACRLAGLKIVVTGKPATKGASLLVSNHVSYLDIPVLGAVADVFFVSKASVRDWPVFGLLARLGNTVFIERDPRQARKQTQTLAGRLAKRHSLILFPEGTSSNGHAVLPFKSSLFAAAEGDGADDVPVQPVTVVYAHYTDGRRLTHGLQDCYAWHGDMTLVPHLYRVLGIGGATVHVIFHAPVKRSDFPDRKAMARHCQARVAEGVSRFHGWHH